MSVPILGWDIGGANLKVARLDGRSAGEPLVVEEPFPVWRDPHKLSSALVKTAGRVGVADVMALTMTAELADCFATKRQGVLFVLEAFRTAFPEAEGWVYGVDGRFRSIEAAREHPSRVAAANWMAGATLVARSCPDALFLDVGSTTTDIIPIVAGRVVARGHSDVGRLRSGELVYTGALRTPVCAVVRWLPLGAHRCRVAAEHFAIAADVHRWLGRITETDYTCETPDGRGRSVDEAGARLARMICSDVEELGLDDITRIAECVARAQVAQIAHGIRQVMRRLGARCPAVAVLAGQGTFLARAAAERHGLSIVDAAAHFGSGGARAAPAVAVAHLLAERTRQRRRRTTPMV
jgi:probable H4MPT-linked C1 transfer pathway protein